MHIPVFVIRLAVVQMRKEQEALKVERVRYDGLCRRLDPDEAARRIAAGERHVIRFKMPLKERLSRTIICAATS